MIQLTRFVRLLAPAERIVISCTLCKKANTFSASRQSVRNFSLTLPYQLPQNFPSSYGNDTWRLKIRRKLGLLAIKKQDITESSARLYVECTDKLDTLLFFKEFEMPDTYFSWFTLTELHLWLLMCRSTKEGPEGEFLRRQLCHRLWEDAEQRLKKIVPGGMALNPRKQLLVEMGDQFRGFILSMDEGLLMDDRTMASALWRNFYCRDCPDPRHLERLIQYVRTQMDHLMSLEKEMLLLQGTIKDPFYWGTFEPFHVS